jgi:hypothetical protein
MSDRGFIGKMLFMTGGLIVWAIHFTVIYGFTSVACAKGFAAVKIFGVGAVPLVIGATTLLALAITGIIVGTSVVRPVPPRSPQYSDVTEHFLQYTAITIAMLSLVAIGWNALPVLVVPPC